MCEESPNKEQTGFGDHHDPHDQMKDRFIKRTTVCVVFQLVNEFMGRARYQSSDEQRQNFDV